MADPQQAFRQYTQSVLRGLRYRATWLPTERLRLGDVGLLDGGVFERWTHLRELGVRFEQSLHRDKWDFDHQSSTGIRQRFKAAGQASDVFESIGKASAGMRFEFDRAGAVIFAARRCTLASVADKPKLERQLRRLPEWNMRWFVVTKLVTTSAATILVSGSGASFVELRAGARVGVDDLQVADLAADFTHARTSNMAVRLVGAGRLTPLYQVHRLIQPGFSRDRNKRRLAAG